MNYKSIVIAIAACCLFSCSEEEKKTYQTFSSPDWKVDLSGYQDSPSWTVNQQNNLSAPDWKLDMNMNQQAPSFSLPDNHVMPASMTAVIQLTPFLETYLDAGDKMLAYIGNECRGEGVLKQIDGKNLFYIFIKAPSAETGKVSFLYYSNKNKAVYQTPADVDFEINKIYGDVENPKFPDFESVGKYPKSMQATIQLSDALPGSFGTGDKVAAFVGDECRGIASLVSGKTFTMEIRGTSADAETVYFKYYNSATKNVFKSETSYPLVNGSVIGSDEKPEVIDVVALMNMSAVVALPEALKPYADQKADKVAAFVGNECRGVGQLDSNTGSYKMQIKGVQGTSEKVRFQYYSANNQYLYTTDAFLDFKADGYYGTDAAPAVLPIEIADKYPLKMHAYFTLPDNLLTYVGTEDKVAAFVGDECRGVASIQLLNGTAYAEMDIIGKIEKEESFLIRYYNQKNQYLYETTGYFSFDYQGVIGSKQNPLCLTLVNVE